MKVAIVLLAVVAAVAAESYGYDKSYKPAAYAAPAYSKPAYKEEYAYAPAHYTFDYAVKDDYTYVDMGHSEARNGDDTKGSYFVVLPDGRKQTVNYYVNGYSGYVADVSYDGYAKAYDYKPAAYSKPAYKAPAYETTYAAPAYKAPAYETTYAAPAYKAEYEPTYSAPAYKTYVPEY